MLSTRRISLCGAAAAIAALFAVPAVASADVYCVDNTLPGCDHTGYTLEAGLQDALDDAAAHAGADTVRIAALTYTAPSPNGFQYDQPDDAITIEGVGAGAGIEMPDPAMVPASHTTFLGLEVQTGPGVPITLSNLKVTLPTPPDAPTNSNQNYLGVSLHALATVSDVTIDGPAGVGINGIGISLTGGTVSNLTLNLPTVGNPGLVGLQQSAFTSADLTVDDSDLAADYPLQTSNSGTGTVLIRGSTLRTGQNGVGAWSEVGQSTIESSVIDLGGAGGTAVKAGFDNPGAHTATVNLDGVTIANGGSGSRGLDADIGFLGATAGGDAFTINARNTIIDQSVETALRRLDDTGASASINTAYSNYDPTSVSETNDHQGGGAPFGTGSITAANNTDLAPAFVGGSDFHLQQSSPLIDIGDPAAPATGATDLDGDPRAVMAIASCSPRRDIGADEFVPVSPVTPLNCAPPPSQGGSTQPPATPPATKKCKKRKRHGASSAKKRCKKRKKH